MQYIKKQEAPPTHWEDWCKDGSGVRTYDYNKLRDTKEIKKFLIHEQDGLCAYCQRELSQQEDRLHLTSIEHVTPNSKNKHISTNYYNLVAVCNDSKAKDTNRRGFCEEERGNTLLPSIIFYSDAQVTKTDNHKYFRADGNGFIYSKRSQNQNVKNQAEVFIDVLNLNHDKLIGDRKSEMLRGISAPPTMIPTHQKKRYWEV